MSIAGNGCSRSPFAATKPQPPDFGAWAAIAGEHLPDLPAPSELLRAASTAHTQPFAYGADFDPALPQSGAEAAKHQLTLDAATEYPDESWLPRYACYRFKLPGYDGEPIIQLGGSVNEVDQHDPVTGEARQIPGTWLGLANWNTGRWSWFPVAGSGQVELASLAPYFAADGSLIAVWMCLNQYSHSQLDWLRIGASPCLIENLPSDLHPVNLEFDGAGKLVLAARDGLNWQILTRQNDEWVTSEFQAAGNVSQSAIGFDAANQPYFLATAWTRDAAARLDTFEELLFNPASALSPDTLLARSYAVPDGPDNPGSGGDQPYIRSAYLTPTGTGEFEAAFSEHSGWRVAWRDGAAWASVLLPTVPRCFTIDPAGRSWVLGVEGAGGGWNGRLVSYLRNGYDWHSQELPGSIAQYWDVAVLHGSGIPRILATVPDNETRSYTPDGQGGREMELLTEVAGQNPVHILAATDADGILRLADRSWVYSSSPEGTLVARPIEPLGFYPFLRAFDAAGKLHQIGELYEAEGSRLVYVREL
jgi:hypothetical protein